MTEKQSANESFKPVPIGSGPMTITLGSIRNSEAYLRWQGAQWVIALNLSAFVALLYRLLSKPNIAEVVVLAIGCAGIASLDYEWYSVVRRNGRLFDFWNKKLTEHESANGIDGGIKIFTSPEYYTLTDSRNRLQRRLERISVIFVAGWSAGAIVLVTLAFVALRGGI